MQPKTFQGAVLLDEYADIQSLNRELRTLNRGFVAYKSEQDGEIIVYHKNPQGMETLFGRYACVGDYILTDARKRLRQFESGRYDPASDIEKAGKRREKRLRDERDDVHGDVAHKLAHAHKQDLGIKDTITVPKAVH